MMLCFTLGVVAMAKNVILVVSYSEHLKLAIALGADKQSVKTPNKAFKQENLQLAVFTAFNILANYKFPLNEAL